MAEVQSSDFLYSDQDGVLIIEFTLRRITEPTQTQRIQADIEALLLERPKPRVLISFASVTQMSSTALGLLVVLQKRVRARQGQIRLCGFSPAVHEVVTLTGIDRLMPVDADFDAALKKLRASEPA